MKEAMLNDSQVAVLTEIARSAGSALNPAQAGELETLLRDGLIEKVSEKYQLTRKGQKVLDDRGVGANEA